MKKKTITTVPITDQKTPATWKEICKVRGISEKIPFNVSKLPSATQNYLISAYKLPIVIETRNEGWVPDYTDLSQSKYELWPDILADKEHPSGFGLSFDVCAYWFTSTDVGVRFAFKDLETAKSVFNDFKSDFENFYLKKA
jgi:hypothetical protein